MANFLLAVDPDQGRREAFLQATQDRLAPIEGLTQGKAEAAGLFLSWAMSPNAPFSHCEEVDEGLAVVMGDAIGDTSRISAEELCATWGRGETSAFWDGFYLGIYGSKELLLVGSDVLGLFPVYYVELGEVLLVGASPELFQYHPLFEKRLNPNAVVSLLMTNGSFGGESMWSGVRRLEAGHLLSWTPELGASEIPQFRMGGAPEEGRYEGTSFDTQLEEIESILESTLRRHVPQGESYGMLLSGGLDSRLLAGMLGRMGAEVTPVTFGDVGDIEMSCAVPVAEALGWKHTAKAVPYQTYPELAENLSRWEHLGNGFNCAMDWGICEQISGQPSRYVAGYLMDRIIGGGKWVHAHNRPEVSFESVLKTINLWGLSEEVLDGLLKPEVFAHTRTEVLEKMRTTYESAAPDEATRSWHFDFYHRQRFHIGSALWQISFGAWPVVPMLDHALLNRINSFPVSTLADRRAQKEMVMRRFPKLARLPLDRNDFDQEPLQPSSFRRMCRKLHGARRRYLRWRLLKGDDRRYYYRTYGIGNSGWQAVRERAEPHRGRLQALMNAKSLEELLPSPGEPVPWKHDGIWGVSGAKALLGLMLWVGQHPDTELPRGSNPL